MGNILKDYSDRDLWLLSLHRRQACSQDESGLGCCMASLEGSDTCSQIHPFRKSGWGMLKEDIGFLEGRLQT